MDKEKELKDIAQNSKDVKENIHPGTPMEDKELKEVSGGLDIQTMIQTAINVLTK